MAKSEYKCVLYEAGDKVKLKHPRPEEEDKVEVIESTEFKYVGIFPTLFLKFVGKPHNISDLSNFYVPAEETSEKYKDDLNYFQEVILRKSGTKSSTKSTSTPKAKVLGGFKIPKKDEVIDLNDEEVFKPKVMSFANLPKRKIQDE